MKKILTVCPTKNRAEICARMVKSFNKTTRFDNDLVLALNIDDEQMSLYQEIKEHKVAVKANSTVTKIINDIYEMYPNYDYYHITNDDVIYHTDGWDYKLTNVLEEYGDGVAYGNDLFQGENCPTFPMISGDIVRKLGWLQYPALNRYCGDVVWKELCKRAECLYYLDQVIIEHKHDGKYDLDVNKSDMMVFANWLPRMQDDVNRVLGVINGKS